MGIGPERGRRRRQNLNSELQRVNSADDWQKVDLECIEEIPAPTNQERTTTMMASSQAKINTAAETAMPSGEMLVQQKTRREQMMRGWREKRDVQARRNASEALQEQTGPGLAKQQRASARAASRRQKGKVTGDAKRPLAHTTSKKIKVREQRRTTRRETLFR